MKSTKHLASSRLPLLLTLLAFGLRLHQLGRRSLWYDELLQVDIAQGPLLEIGSQLSLHAAMPLDYLLLHGWLGLGRSEFWVRWPALCFGTLAVPLIYALARRLFKGRTGRRVGLLAAALLTPAAFAVQYSQEVRPYALLTMLTLVGYLGLWQVYATGHSRYWGLVWVGLVGSLLSHYFALFMLLPTALFVAAHQLAHLRRPRMWLNTGAFALCCLLLLVALLVSGRFKPLYNVSFGLAGALQAPSQVIQPAAEKPNRGSGPPLERTFIIDRLISPLATHRPGALLLYTTFFLAALLSLLRRPQPHRNALLLLLGWLILPILAIYFFLIYRGTFYATRYILYTLPAYLILVAYGLESIVRSISYRKASIWKIARLPQLLDQTPSQPPPPRSRSKISPRFGGIKGGLRQSWIALSLLLLVPLLAAEIDELRSHYAAETREDWRAVGDLLQTHARPGDAVIAVWAEPALNWYYPPATAPFHTYSRNESLWQTIQAHPRRWFVLSSYSRSRDEALRAWLRENDAVTIGIDRRVVVYLQQEGVSRETLLAEVARFDLPAKGITYLTVARQLQRNGDLTQAHQFYRRALAVANPDLQRLIAAELKDSEISGR